MQSETPTDWRRPRFSDLFVAMKRLHGDDSLPVLSVTVDGITLQSDHFRKKVASADTRGYLRVRRGEVATSGLNLWKGGVGMQTIVDEGIVSPAYKVYGLRPGSADGDFMRHYIRSPPMFSLYRDVSQQGASIVRRNVDYDRLYRARIPLPPLPEQKKIAAILSSVDEAIQATQAVIEQTRRVKEGLLQDLLTRGIGHTRFKQTEIGEIPESWSVRNVESALSIENTRRKPISSTERKSMRGPYPYWGPTKVLDYLNEYGFDGDYALIGEDGDHFLKFGDWEMTRWATGKFNVNNHAHVIGDGQDCLARWFFYFFMHRDLMRTGALTRQGAGRYKLTKAALSIMPLAVPPMCEQRAIIEQLDGIRDSLGPQRASVEQLKKTKAGLLQDLLTGKVRVSP